jgi:iron(III) transport system ATP-binding protein
VFVTHDQEEALLLGDRVAVINAGRLEQVDTPEGIFHAPRTRFVAGFLGRADFLPAVVTPRGLATELGILQPRIAAVDGDAPEGTVEVLVRPDDVAIAPSVAGVGTVLDRMFLGAEVLYRVRLPSGMVLHSRQSHAVSIERGAVVKVWLAPGHPLVCFRDGRAVGTVEVPVVSGDISGVPAGRSRAAS